MTIRIPLFQGNSLGFERDMVIFTLKSNRIPILFGKAVVDNGCPYTIISEVAFRKIRFNYRSRREIGIVQIYAPLKIARVKT